MECNGNPLEYIAGVGCSGNRKTDPDINESLQKAHGERYVVTGLPALPAAVAAASSITQKSGAAGIVPADDSERDETAGLAYGRPTGMDLEKWNALTARNNGKPASMALCSRRWQRPERFARSHSHVMTAQMELK